MTKLEESLKELEETWGYTIEELNDIKEKIVFYAYACQLDSKVAGELTDVLLKDYPVIR